MDPVLEVKHTIRISFLEGQLKAWWYGDVHDKNSLHMHDIDVWDRRVCQVILVWSGNAQTKTNAYLYCCADFPLAVFSVFLGFLSSTFRCLDTVVMESWRGRVRAYGGPEKKK